MWTRLPKQAAKGSLFEQDQYELCEPIKRRGESKCVSPFEELEKDNTLYSLLKELRKEMEKSSFKSLKQPPEGSYF